MAQILIFFIFLLFCQCDSSIHTSPMTTLTRLPLSSFSGGETIKIPSNPKNGVSNTQSDFRHEFMTTFLGDYHQNSK
jgi:hypothetical protein